MNQYASSAIASGGVSRQEARELLELAEGELFESASQIREHFFANEVEACFIINAKSGNCNMNCKFCSQSGANSTEIEHYPFKQEVELEAIVRSWEQFPIGRCGIVTAGGALTDADVEKLACWLEKRRDSGRKGPRICGSLGRLKTNALRRLRDAGMTRIHHNLETSEGYYPEVCTSQQWRDRLDTVHQAQQEGFSVCSGGLFGLGESWEDRLDFAFFLREDGIDHIPVNFLYPHPGTPMANQPVMDPAEALRIIAVYRHIHPCSTIRVCGGRVSVLRERQFEMFSAGANAFMTGNYLTISGAGPQEDLKVLETLGLQIVEELEIRA